MKTQFWLLAAVLTLAPAAFVGAHGDHKHGEHEEAGAKAAAGDKVAAADTKTVEGDIVDLACYLAHGEKGEKHMKCAKQCIIGGAPAGLLDAEGKLYLLVEDHANPKPYGQMKKLAGEKAKVTGRVVQKNGMQAMIVGSAAKGK